jgi:hypothetical protein
MRMKLATLFLSIGIASCAHGSGLDALQLQREVAAFGGKYVIGRYFTCDRTGEVAYNEIASGKPEWLALAVRLKEDSDACVSGDLNDAIARALLNAPTEVLGLVDTMERFSAEKICMPFFSAEEPPEPALQHLARMRAVLATVQVAELQRQKERCLAKAVETESAISRALTLQSTGTQQRPSPKR